VLPVNTDDGTVRVRRVLGGIRLLTAAAAAAARVSGGVPNDGYTITRLAGLLMTTPCGDDPKAARRRGLRRLAARDEPPNAAETRDVPLRPNGIIYVCA